MYICMSEYKDCIYIDTHTSMCTDCLLSSFGWFVVFFHTFGAQVARKRQLSLMLQSVTEYAVSGPSWMLAGLSN